MTRSIPRMLPALALLLGAQSARAQFATTEVSGPGSPTPFRITASGWTWEEITGVTYDVHRSAAPACGFSTVLAGHPSSSWTGDEASPGPGGCFYYLVTAFDGNVSNLPGTWSNGTPRSFGACFLAADAFDGAPDCGTNASPNILGTVDEDAVTLLDDGGNVQNLMRIEIPRIPPESSFSILQLEIELTKFGPAGDDIPTFVSGRIVGGLQGGGTYALPDVFPLEVDQMGEADLDGSDGRMRLRWHDSFCAGGICDFPVAAATPNPLVVELSFAGQMCDVLVEAVNFRVPFEDSGILRDLLCSQRAAVDPDPPDVSGAGRGPAVVPEIACFGCDLVGCPTCQCPLNDAGDVDIAMDLDPVVVLLDGVDAGPDSVLQATYVQNSACDSPQCDFAVSGIALRIECDSVQDCLDFYPLPSLYDGSRLVHGDGSSVDLGLPNFLIDEGDPAYSEYQWTNLDIAIVDDESFAIEVYFDSSLAVARITRLDLRVGGALPSVCTANGLPGGTEPPLCRMVSPVIDLVP